VGSVADELAVSRVLDDHHKLDEIQAPTTGSPTAGSTAADRFLFSNVAAEDYKSVSRTQWSEVAGAWERHAERLDRQSGEAATAWMLEAVGPRPGERVLELACGPAGVGLQAARAVGPDGHVLSTDFAQAMVDAARRRAEEEKIENMDFRIVDAESVDLPDESFDAVVCRYGYMLMGDPGAALRETCRVLVPGGRVALAVWGEAGENPWASTPMLAVMEHFDAPPPEPGAPGMFALADEDRLRRLLEEAGFSEIRVERVEAVERYESLDAWWNLISQIAGALATLLAGLSDTDRDAIRKRASEMASQYADDGALRFPSGLRLAAASRP
jgi:ubiquinone/menaquinone biosynthesis C-methylase UbiE